jgi:FKBP-type peptidyl-prolyl cis-trans isomerase
MKKISIILMCCLLVLAVGCSKSGNAGVAGEETTAGDQPITLDTEKQQASYAFGYNVGMNVKHIVTELDFDIFIKGLKDASMGGEAKMTQPEMQKVFREFNQKLMKKQQEERKILGEKNKVEGAKFLEENAKKEGVKVTASGLQYLVLSEGTGAQPKTTDRVKVHYRGTLLDGTEFDSSYKRGEPAVFPLNRVIPGWTEGLQLMKVGSKYKFFIPSELGYKERGSRAIGPNAVLQFDVELLSIEPPLPKPAPRVTPKPKQK